MAGRQGATTRRVARLYTLMSLAPLLILAVAVAGLMFGEEAARGQISHQLAGVLGDQGALAVQAITSAGDPGCAPRRASACP